MSDLINFIIRYSSWFFFVLYMALSGILLFNQNTYQQHIYLTSANAVSSKIYSGASAVSSYFNLNRVNEDLNKRNAMLHSQLLALEEEVQYLRDRLPQPVDSLSPQGLLMRDDPQGTHYTFVTAHVINNSIAKTHNYLTIDVGSTDSIAPEMGVIDANGVVGVVNVVGPHYSRVISLLNPNFRLSCKIKGSDNFGSLVWDGNDSRYALLQELPRHTTFKVGDTIVTSGYSAVFPKDIPVGIVYKDNDSPNDNFFTLKIKLLTDFSSLSNVQVVINHRKDELLSVQENDANETIDMATTH